MISCLYKLALASAGVAGLAAGGALAQTPQDRAREIAEWRSNCNDPDPDLRLAYLEAAVELGGTPARICTMASLSSDDANMRELGLRTYLAGADRLRFDVEMPADFTRQLEAARDDRARSEVEREWSRVRNARNFIQNVLVLQADSVSTSSAVSRWYVVPNNDRIEDYATATLTLRGDQLAGTGQTVGGGNTSFNLNVQLSEDGAALVGTLMYQGQGPYLVSARLN